MTKQVSLNEEEISMLIGALSTRFEGTDNSPSFRVAWQLGRKLHRALGKMGYTMSHTTFGAPGKDPTEWLSEHS